MQFIEIGGVTLHYQLIGGPAHKPVIVFVNSLGTDFRIWRDVIVHLAGDFPIVTYDKRGHGLSDVGEAPYAMEDHVGDLEALLDHLNVKNAIICGLSVGGMIAQGLYAQRPDLVRALILCDTAHKIGTVDGWNARIATVEKDGIAAISDGVMKVWFTPAFHANRKAELDGCRNMLTRQTVAGYAGTCAALRDADYTEVAANIAVPTLCIVGDQDGSTPPELVRTTAELIPGARFEVIENAGHIPCVEQPAALIELIRNFLAELPSGERHHG
ncbi:3-oxoadipate enol-lactonase [Pseudaminobacter soli (ex Li et al. 2025)]|uniref:3-oxoadipate enol-lactonase n=1 Tax=Pseudaminobacter soli (ex Li et al. 2025) TaxID=1295366 RepID=A0A2P7SL16_9HYPH|nr:3-oxoadipate enol-lactonase [Mesorhizobium soli]PSJ63194.1 3-oxoadipate enol-lactonase [Mesorhizobium soli]